MNPLDRAIYEARGVGKLARAINVGQSVVSNWRSRGTVVPAEHCAAIENATGKVVTRQDLRPDDWPRIWPELVAPTPANAAGRGG